MKHTHIKITILCLLFFAAAPKAQLYVAAGETLFTKSGETLHAYGLTLYPATDFTLTDNELNRNNSTLHALPTTYVQRVFRFSNNTPAFSGTIEVNYLDAELNTLTETSLKTAVHNGNVWQLVNTSANSTVTNYVLSNSVTNLVLNEITMAGTLVTLPLQWLSFTIQKKENNAVLNWSTVSEHNTKDFIVEHSQDGSRWEPVGTVIAGGQVTNNHYSYTHVSPGTGKHFYRLLQRDNTGNNNYSQIQFLLFSSAVSGFSLYPNPVNEGQLTIQLQQATSITLYNTAGAMIMRKDLPAGKNQIRLSQLPKGVYYLQAGKEMAEIVIQ